MPAKPKQKPRDRKPPLEEISLSMVQRKVGGLVAIDARVPMDIAQAIARLIYPRMQRDRIPRAPKARHPR